MTTATQTNPNGIDVGALGALCDRVRADPREGVARFRAATHWRGGTLSETEIDGWSLGGREFRRPFTIRIDEPPAILGQDRAPNPQEYLLAAMNACMLNTFIAVCATMDVELERVTLESSGLLDLRGFLGLDPNVPAGYEALDYTFRVKGNGTEAQYRKAHEAVKATSPNFYNMANAITMRSALVAE